MSNEPTMKKLATLLVFGAVLAVGLPGQAMAANDAVTVFCAIHPQTQTQNVVLSQFNAGSRRPSSCVAVPSSSCSQCIADLLSSRFNLAGSFNVDTQAPYFVFTK